MFQPNISFTHVSLIVCVNDNEATGASAVRIEDVYTTQDYQLVLGVVHGMGDVRVTGSIIDYPLSSRLC